MTVLAHSAVAVGDRLPTLEVRLTRADLVRYAGASLDLNPIHWSERFATGVGLDGVIAHGMLTMAVAGRVVTAWCGDPGAVLEHGVVFTRPVLVPDDDEGATVVVGGRVSKVDPERRTATVALTVTAAGQKVLGRSSVVVRLA